MRPRCWLLRGSWRLEHNQCHSLYLFRGVPFLSNPRKSGSTEARDVLLATLTRLSTRTWEEPSNHGSPGRHLRGLAGFLKKIVDGRFVQ